MGLPCHAPHSSPSKERDFVYLSQIQLIRRANGNQPPWMPIRSTTLHRLTGRDSSVCAECVKGAKSICENLSWGLGLGWYGQCRKSFRNIISSFRRLVRNFVDGYLGRHGIFHDARGAQGADAMNRRELLTRTVSAMVGARLAARAVPMALGAAPARAARPAIKGPLRVHPTNRRYFGDGQGRAVYLTGSHTWNSLVDLGPTDPPPRFDFPAYLGFLDRYGHNFVRLWTWELLNWNTAANQEKRRQVHTMRPLPYARTGPGEAVDGKPKFNLTQFDPEYFERLRTRVSAARDRGIYVSVMLFEGWGLQMVEGSWKQHPFHPENNVSGVGGGVAEGVDIHTLKHARIREIQEAYVRKVLDTVNDMDNVLYEISNENHPASTEWQYAMIRFVKEYERGKSKQHPVGMTFQYKGGSNRTLFDSPADWISPNPEGGYRDDPPAADGRKVILNDTDHLWGIGGSRGWVWKSFLRGHNPIFMDPYDGLVLQRGERSQWEPVRRAMGATRQLAERLELAAVARAASWSRRATAWRGRAVAVCSMSRICPREARSRSIWGARRASSRASGSTLRREAVGRPRWKGERNARCATPGEGEVVLWLAAAR